MSVGKYGSQWKQGRWEICNDYCGLIAEGLHLQPLNWHLTHAVHDHGAQPRTRFQRFIPKVDFALQEHLK